MPLTALGKSFLRKGLWCDLHRIDGWSHTGLLGDIIAYRITSLPSTKPTAEDVLRQIAALPRSKGARKMAREWLDGNSPPKGPTP